MYKYARGQGVRYSNSLKTYSGFVEGIYVLDFGSAGNRLGV
jgi:hypothetical protein